VGPGDGGLDVGGATRDGGAVLSSDCCALAIEAFFLGLLLLLSTRLVLI